MKVVEKFEKRYHSMHLNVKYRDDVLSFATAATETAVPTLINYKSKGSRFYADINWLGDECTVEMYDFQMSESGDSISYRVVDDGSLGYMWSDVPIPDPIPEELVGLREWMVYETCEYHYNKIANRIINGVQNEGLRVNTDLYDNDDVTIHFDGGRLEVLELREDKKTSLGNLHIKMEEGQLIYCNYQLEVKHPLLSLSAKDGNIHYSTSEGDFVRSLKVTLDIYNIVEKLLNLPGILEMVNT